MANKEQLVRFLDERVFDPILKADAGRYDTTDRDDLKYVQDRTRAEKERYHQYDSATKVLQMFRDDLRSPNARPVNAKLQKLDLPRLADVEREFEELAA